ncbi:DUF4189 domain-containing protein [Pseudonocardia sp. GCM10023141]|uniref:DUF4189 domain-containing protein n=1 Tax=Pseudonocardia sp. GCM10023141 TaxID=3252653 RepID=UPI00361FC3CE
MIAVRSLVARAAVASVLAGSALVLGAGPAGATTIVPTTTVAATTTANHWGAIAISVRTGRTGYGNDYSTAAAASKAAVSKCGASDCQEVVRVANGCAAVAQAPNRAWGWAYAASKAAAQNKAISATPGKGARIITWICTTGHQ